MITLLFLQKQKGLFTILGERIQEGGPKTMTLLLILFLVGIALIIRSFILYKKGENTRKNIVLINSIGFFALVLGVLGHISGLIGTFDEIGSLEAVDHITLGNGIKLTLLPIFFGSFIFLFTRAFTIILTGITPKKYFENE